MQGTYLVTATLAGVIIYAEPITLTKILGVVGYFAAFTIMNNATWDAVSKKLFT